MNKDKTEFLYGVNPVMEALKAGRTLKEIFIHAGREARDIEKEARKRGVPVKIVDEASFFDSKFPKGHQGIAASVVSRTLFTPLEKLLQIPEEGGFAPFFVILDLVEDPRNLGAILRSAEAAGVRGVVIQKRRAAGLGPAAAKTSAGAVEYVPVSEVSNIKHAIEEMKKRGIAVIGAEAGADITAWKADLGGPIALVIGSEGRGLRRTVKERCDFIVSLPMRGRVNSLNTSVAAGILIFEVLRQRSKKNEFF